MLRRNDHNTATVLDPWGFPHPARRGHYMGSNFGVVSQITPTYIELKRPVSGASVRIYDETGNLLPPGQAGEVYLWVEGWPDFTYHNQPDKRRECARDGLVSLGDVGYLDADGYLFLCDRKREMVIFAATNIYPAEIEAELLAMPGVHDCAMFGIPDDEYGERLAAHIEPQMGATLTSEAVRGFLSARLASYKIPHVIKFETGLPREDSGKIIKRRLRDPYWAGTGRNI